MPYLNLNTIRESEVPTLDDDTLCAAVAQWCEGCIVEWAPNIKGDMVWRIAKDKDCWLESLENSKYRYLTDGNAAFRLMVKYDIVLEKSHLDKRYWCAKPFESLGDARYCDLTPHRAVAEAALVVELRAKEEL